VTQRPTLYTTSSLYTVSQPHTSEGGGETVSTLLAPALPLPLPVLTPEAAPSSCGPASWAYLSPSEPLVACHSQGSSWPFQSPVPSACERSYRCLTPAGAGRQGNFAAYNVQHAYIFTKVTDLRACSYRAGALTRVLSFLCSATPSDADVDKSSDGSRIPAETMV